jgi:uncharacterized protein YjbJ (UPF0337 family)
MWFAPGERFLLDGAQTAGLGAATMPDQPQREIDMGRDRLMGICVQFQGRLKEHWGILRVDPMIAAAGRRDRIAGRVQEQRGLARERTERALKDFLARNRNWQDLSSG